MGITENLIGKNIKEVHSIMDKSFNKDYELIFNNGKEITKEENGLYVDRVINFETTKTPVIDNGEVIGIVTIMRDITEKKELENKLQLIAMVAEENQKKTFAEDLHDGMGAILATMKMYINKILSKSTLEEAKDLLQVLKEIILEAIENTKNIAYKLTPHVLINFGLIKALEEYITRINCTNDIIISFKKPQIYQRPDINIEISIYRILQELLNNSIKHF